MTTLKRLGSYAAMIALFATSTAAHAQIYQNGSVNVDANINGTTDLRRSATSTQSGSANPNTATSAQMNANINSRINSSTTGSTTASTTAGAGATLSLTRSDIKGDKVMSRNAADVTTSNDLSDYARSLLSNDENIVKVESDADSVSIWYKEPAKFLGIVPLMVTVQATVNADGTVKIDYPWWYDLFV
jgi:hypothetical protein